MQRCSSREQTPDTGGGDDDNDHDDDVADNDKGAVADVDEPSSYPTPDTESRDRVPVPDVIVARVNADTPAVKPCVVPTCTASVASSVSLREFCLTM